MKLFLIKVGKAFKTIQRDGIFKGGKRVSQAFFALFRKVGSGDILFITGGVGDSARYRTQHVAEELETHGLKCSVTVQDNPLLAGYADKFKIFIFHRVLFTPGAAKLIEKIKAQNKEIIFETDDLVYDPQYLKYMDYFQQMNSFERKLYENGVGGEILADDYVKVCTTTTSFLAEKLGEKNKKVFIVPNKLSNEDLEICNNLITRNQKPKTNIKIGYFSGALSHNKDFATITKALMLIMEKYPNVSLFLAGPLDIESQLNKFKGRIEQAKYVPREKHFENIAGVDINIAPLEIGNPFCEGKSELKFFEAGILRVPTVAAATQTFKEAIEDGVDSFVASTNEEWFDKIEKLVLDEKLRRAMGEKAREKALRAYTVKNSNNQKYYDYLKSKL